MLFTLKYHLNIFDVYLTMPSLTVTFQPNDPLIIASFPPCYHVYFFNHSSSDKLMFKDLMLILSEFNYILLWNIFNPEPACAMSEICLHTWVERTFTVGLKQTIMWAVCIFFSASTVIHVFNPNAWEVEAGKLLWVWGPPDLHSKLPEQPRLYRKNLSQNKTRQNKKPTPKPNNNQIKIKKQKNNFKLSSFRIGSKGSYPAYLTSNKAHGYSQHHRGRELLGFLVVQEVPRDYREQ